MIKSFRHKGLEIFFRGDSMRGIQAGHASKLGRILRALNVAKIPMEMNLPGYDLHRLKGDLKGHWSVSVSGNWRVIFVFVDSDVDLVDYLDYH